MKSSHLKVGDHFRFSKDGKVYLVKERAGYYVRFSSKHGKTTGLFHCQAIERVCPV